MVDPSLAARIWDYFWVLLFNWKGAVATACLLVLSIPQLLPPDRRAKLDELISSERRRKILVFLAFASLFIASFEAYDDIGTKNRALSEQLSSRSPSPRN